MRGHSVCFRLEIRKIIFELSSIPPPIWSSAIGNLSFYLSGPDEAHDELPNLNLHCLPSEF